MDNKPTWELEFIAGKNQQPENPLETILWRLHYFQIRFLQEALEGKSYDIAQFQSEAFEEKVDNAILQV